MATYEKRGEVWRAQIRRVGHSSVSGSFDSKAAAEAWASKTEAGILSGKRGEIPDMTFGELLERYAREVSPTKRGMKWEFSRIDLLRRDLIATYRLKDLDSKAVAQWRDRRLARGVKGATVRREWTLMCSACTVAVGEWHWLPSNPFGKDAGAKRPKGSPHRTELITEADLAALEVAAAGVPAYQRVLRCVRFSIETAMRAGEVVYLGHNPDNVNTVTRVAHLPITKNGNARDVALSPEAIRLWEEARVHFYSSFGYNHWGLDSAELDYRWRALRNKAGLGRLHYHDTRHTAITRLAKKLAVLDLARMAGITDLKILLVYYNESAADIALKL